MSAVHLTAFGLEPLALSVVDAPAPAPPAAGRVTIKFRLSPVNPADIFS
jgi:NADPH:quinone reductase-like Zn-dependent oxidoreductase